MTSSAQLLSNLSMGILELHVVVLPLSEVMTCKLNKHHTLGKCSLSLVPTCSHFCAILMSASTPLYVELTILLFLSVHILSQQR